MIFNQASGVGFTLRQPSGSALFTNVNTDRTIGSLPATGTYTLSVDQRSGSDRDYVGSYSFRVVDGPTTPPLPPAADLRVTQVAAPEEVSGSPAEIPVSWTVTNTGPAATDASAWIDRVITSTNDTLGDADDRAVAQLEHTGQLAAAASYTASTTFTMPLGFQGDLRVFVHTDPPNRVFENQSETNNSASAPNRTAISPAVDTIGPVVNAATPTGTITVPLDAFEVQFSETVQGFDSQDVTIRLPGGTTLASGSISVSPLGALSYRLQFPAQQADGTYGLTLGTDIFDLASNRLGWPDPAPFEHQVTVDRTGPQVIAVTPAAPVPGPISQVEITFSEPLRAGSFVSGDVQLTGPAGPIPVTSLTPLDAISYRITFASQSEAGDYTLSVGPDVEDVPGNMMDEPFAGTFTIALPDLTVESPAGVENFGLPGAATWGSDLDLAWTIRNIGNDQASPSWIDRVWLSQDQALDGQDTLLASEPGPQSPLDAADTYTTSTAIVLPLGPSFAEGTYCVLVETDATRQVLENRETNNLAVSAPVAISFPPLPDLRVAEVVAPTAGQLGQTVTISWTVTNAGAAAAEGNWTDRLYLSLDGGLAGATQVGSLAHTAALAQEATYSALRNVTLPSVPDGDYHVLVVTDTGSAVFEGSQEGNNQTSAAALLQLRHADLVPQIVSAPTASATGVTETIGWRTTNSGSAATLAAWTERLYLSADTQPSADDLLLAQVQETQPLAAGASRDAEQQVTLPFDRFGDFYWLVVIDAANTIPEGSGEADNRASQSVSIAETPYADLEVTDLQLVLGGAEPPIIGDPATMTVSWQVANLQGTGAGLTPRWTDAVIASSDELLGNADDVLLARFENPGPLARGQSYQRANRFSCPRV